MANLAYAHQFTDTFSAFFGAGAGLAKAETDFKRLSGFVRSDGDDTKIAAQVFGGLAYDVSDTVSLFAKYSYFFTIEDSFEFTNEYTGLVDGEFGDEKTIIYGWRL